MQTQVNILYDYAKDKYNLTFLAGQKGFHNSVFWVYLAEDIQNISFLKGGEMIITTGLFTKSGTSLFSFIKAMKTRNCSCIILNTGKYIQPEDITDEIIEFCDSNKFPLFTLPWGVRLIDLMQDYCRMLLLGTQQADHLSAAFQSAMHQPEIPEDVLRVLHRHGYPTVAEYRIIIIQNLHDTTMITSPLNTYNVKYHLFFYDNLQILIYHTDTAKYPLRYMIELLCYCDSIILGISDKFNVITQLSQNYKRARFAYSVALIRKKSYVVFNELGIFQLLFTSSDTNVLQSIYKAKLAPLEEHDLEHGTDYVITLKHFLLSDCNLVETAARLFTHRNTIVYRISKIKDILDIELDDFTVKFDILLAFYIKEYLSI